MCSSAETPATVRPTGFETRLLPTLTRSYPRRFTFYVARPTRSIHQNRGAGFPRPTRHSSWPPAVKFAPCEPYAESQVLQRFEADATFTHVELLAALLV